MRIFPKSAEITYICAMNKSHLTASARDPMGAAIHDYFHTGKAARLRVLSPMFDEDEMPVGHLFRTYAQMPPLEQCALDRARGRVLDVGAGAGCHSLCLHDRGFSVTSLDISPLSCKVMRERGLPDVRQQNIMDPAFVGQWDTILLLMNGIGMAGTLEGLPALLQRLRRMLAPGGQILTDSADIRYVYEDEDGQLLLPADYGYYGQIRYQMRYRRVVGEWFPWFYIDYPLLATLARAQGFGCSCVAQGAEHDYLALLS